MARWLQRPGSTYRELVPCCDVSRERQEIPPRSPLSQRGAAKAVVACLFGLVLATVAAAATPPAPRLAGLYDRWLASVDHLLTSAERTAFLGLEHDVHRELFMHGFWAARGNIEPGQDGPLARWQRSFSVAIDRYGSLEDDRARALMVAGVAPDEQTVICDDVIQRLEIWRYDAWHAAARSGRPDAGGFVLVFYRDGPFGRTSVHGWAPADGLEVLVHGGRGRVPESTDEVLGLMRAARCLRAQGEAETVRAALDQAVDMATLVRRLASPAAEPSWLGVFQRQLEHTRPTAAALPGAPLEIDFPGRYNDQRTIVEGRIVVPQEAFARTADGQLYDRLEVVGDIFAGDRLVDSFRTVFYLTGTPPADGLVRVTFHRKLRPAKGYRLSVRAVCGNGLAAVRAERSLDVPRLTGDAEPPAGSRLGFAGLTRPEAGVLITFPSLELRLPGAEVAGPTEIEAVSAGGPIDRVAFRLDDGAEQVDASPPWSARFDLGTSPVRHSVHATAYDAAGRPLADDRLLLNAAPPRFAVRLGEPRGGEDGGRWIDAWVDVPAGERLDRVEIYQDDRRLAVLRRPPFSVRLADASRTPTSWVRAVAALASGAELEDVIIASSSVPVESIDVRLVELYVSALDRQGRPVSGLGREAFTVREEGAVRPVVRFDQVATLPVVVGLLMDTSASMRRGLATAAASARRFFDTVIGPRDLAMLTAFNHEIQLLEPFTDDVRRLDYATAGLRAWGTTRLHDGILYALSGFGGQSGRRALIVLSDGHDVDSDFDARQVLEAARRAGIAVYPVVLDTTNESAFEDLETLAVETGGRFFHVASVDQLDGVYARIEQDLRAQYLLVIQPSASGPRSYRRVEVEILGDGLRARTASGYHP